MNVLIIASALYGHMNSRSAPVAPGTQQAFNTCVVFEKQKYMCAVCHPSEPKLQDSSAFGLVCCYITRLGDTLLGSASVTSPRNIIESSDMTAQVSAVGTFLFPGQFEMKIRVDGTQQEVI